MATTGGTLSAAWRATKWSARNLTPLGKNGRLVWALGGVTALALTMAAPPVAFASAAQGITASSGVASYMGAGLDIAFEGAKTLGGAGAAIVPELPKYYADAVAKGAASFTP